MFRRLRSLSRSETSRAAELGIAAMGANVVALVFTLVFTRVLGQSDYGSLAALVSTFLILNVPGYALQTTVAREVGAAVAAGDPDPGAAGGPWARRRGGVAPPPAPGPPPPRRAPPAPVRG